MNSSNKPKIPLRVGRILRDVRISRRPSTSRRGPAKTEAEETEEIQQAIEQAREQGEQDGYARAASEFASTASVFRAAAAAYERERNALHNQADEWIVSLSLAIARKVLDREIRDGEAVRDVLSRALAEMPAQTAVRVRLNPRDLQMLEELRGRLRDSGEQLPEDVVLCPDSSVSRGGCILESPAGNVDARIETQLALIAEALRADEEPGGGDVRHDAPSS